MGVFSPSLWVAVGIVLSVILIAHLLSSLSRRPTPIQWPIAHKLFFFSNERYKVYKEQNYSKTFIVRSFNLYNLTVANLLPDTETKKACSLWPTVYLRFGAGFRCTCRAIPPIRIPIIALQVMAGWLLRLSAF